MFFLIGRRYPWLSIVVGAVLLGIGVATGDVRYGIVGCLGLAFGAFRCVVALRQRGLSGLIGRPRGTGGMLR